MRRSSKDILDKQPPKFPPTKTLYWQLKRRADVQRLMVDLFGLASDKPTKLLKSIEHNKAFHLLSAASFSLWRAVFLTHARRTPEAVLEHCWEFLGTVVRDNAITFMQDRETRDWTVGYYLSNANFRLLALSRLKCLSDNKKLKKYARNPNDGIVWENPVKRWNAMYRVLLSTHKSFRSTLLRN
jgi:hypothetical protein